MTPSAETKEPLATVSLVLGCLALVLGPISGVPAIIYGHLARSRLRKPPEASGAGEATAGLFTGYVFSVLMTLAFLHYVAPLLTAH